MAKANEAVDLQRQALRKSCGEWLRNLREQSGLSQRELAEQLDIGYYTFVSQIESGRGRIPPERYNNWAEALNLEPKAFVREILKYYEPSTYRILFDS